MLTDINDARQVSIYPRYVCSNWPVFKQTHHSSAMEIFNTPSIMHLTNVLKDLTRNILVSSNEPKILSHYVNFSKFSMTIQLTWADGKLMLPEIFDLHKKNAIWMKWTDKQLTAGYGMDVRRDRYWISTSSTICPCIPQRIIVVVDLYAWFKISVRDKIENCTPIQ